MGIFDGLVTELSTRFGLGDKAGPLLSGLLALITDSDKGGLTGFLDRLRRGGLGDQVASWVGTGTNATVAPAQLEQALGRDAVERVSASAGVPASTGSSALAFLIPKVVDLLTPGGSVPAGLPAGIGGYLAGAAGMAGAAAGGVRQAGRDVGSAASGFGTAATTGAGAAAVAGGSALRKVVPLLLVLLLGFLGYRFMANRGVTEAPSSTRTDTTAMVPAEPAAGAGDMAADSAARADETDPARQQKAAPTPSRAPCATRQRP